MKLLGYRDLRERGISYSRTHLWRLVRAGKFPKPVKLIAGGANFWPEHEIDELLEQRSAERSAA
jgi:prophage regulatory protein